MAESPSLATDPGASDGPGEFRSRAAAWLLVALVVLAPWPFGSAHPRAAQGIAALGALAALATARPASGRRALAACAASLALWALAWLQLVPLPPELHRALAGGSAAVWHPAAPAAAAVLGAGAHPVSLDPAATLRFIGFFGGLVGLALAAREHLRTRTALLRATAVVVSGALLVAVYGLVARLLFGDKLYGVLDVPTIAPFGPFVSKNHFAGYVELAACLAVGLAAGLADEARRGPEWLSWLESRRAVWVVAAWGAAAVLVLAVPVSLSRGGVVSLAAGLAAFAALRLSTRRAARRRRWSVALAGAALLALALVVAALLPKEARARVATLGDVSQAGSYRLDVWRDSGRLFAASPLLGSGLGAFQDALPRFKTGAGYVRVEHAENDYLELLCDAGALGLVLALLGASALLVSGFRSLRDEPHRLARGVRAGALAGLAALLVHSAFDFNLRIPSNALLAALLVALALPGEGFGALAVPPQCSHLAGGRRLRHLAVALPFAVSLGVALFTPWTSSAFEPTTLRRATAGSESGLRSAALERDVTAHLRRRPADAPAWAALAWLRLPRSAAEAEALAAWSQTLDPQHAALRAASQRIRDAATRSGATSAAQSQPRTP